MTHQEVVASAVRESLRSPCRSKRGVVIFDETSIICAGYNHQPSPFICDGSARCKSTCGKTAVHAEQDAILRIQRGLIPGMQMLHVKTVDGILVQSGPPSCMECSKLILESGIAHMWLYDGLWVRYTAVEFHELTINNHGIVQLRGFDAL